MILVSLNDIFKCVGGEFISGEKSFQYYRPRKYAPTVGNAIDFVAQECVHSMLAHFYPETS